LEKAADAFRTISEVAADLHLPQHVLRFWESRFPQIRPLKRAGGRRYYRPDDVDLLRGIRHLLYGEGYTIRGVQRILREHGLKFVQTVWQPGATQPAPPSTDDLLPSDQEPRVEQDAASGMMALQSSPPLSRIEPEVRELPSGTNTTAAPLRPVDVQRLRTVLEELGECRRIIDAALRPEAA
jgi:DNA-binding transcriptional MerR regulator